MSIHTQPLESDLAREWAYLGEEGAFGGRNVAGSKFAFLPAKQIENELNKLYTYQKMRAVAKPRFYNPVYVRKTRQLLQMDLAEYPLPAMVEATGGQRYLLLIMDTFSKMAWARPLPNKEASTVLAAFRAILENEMKRPNKIGRILADRGKEFVNRLMLSYLQARGIELIHPNYKASGVERLIRTIQGITYKYMEHYQDLNWAGAVPKILETYNRTIHRMTKLPPILADLPYNRQRVINVKQRDYSILERPVKKKPRFKVGDTVYAWKLKGRFAKGYHPNFKMEIFVITKVHDKLPIPMYELKTFHTDEKILGRWYAQELQPTKGEFHRYQIIGRQRHGGVDYIKVLFEGESKPHWMIKSILEGQ